MDDMFDLMKVVLILTTGLGLGFVGTSLIYAMKTKEVIEEEIKPLLNRVKYVDRYKTDISGQQDDENIESGEYRTIYEATPNGGIFLKYNKEAQMFEYWGSNSISYEVLCVSIRKYCVQFLCAHLYQETQPDTKENESEMSEEDQELFLVHPKTKQVEKQKDDTSPKKPKLPQLKIRCVGSIEDYDILTGRTKTIDDSTEVISWSAFKKIKESMK